MTEIAGEPGVAVAQEPQEEAPPKNEGNEYEFSQEENLVIGACANRARIFAILCAISGFVHVVAVAFAFTGAVNASGMVYLLPTAIFNIVLGVLLFRASTALGKVVTTAGSDVTLMMNALTNFSKAFIVQLVLAAVVLTTIVGTIVAMALAARFG